MNPSRSQTPYHWANKTGYMMNPARESNPESSDGKLDFVVEEGFIVIYIMCQIPVPLNQHEIQSAKLNLRRWLATFIPSICGRNTHTHSHMDAHTRIHTRLVVPVR